MTPLLELLAVLVGGLLLGLFTTLLIFAPALALPVIVLAIGAGWAWRRRQTRTLI